MVPWMDGELYFSYRFLGLKSQKDSWKWVMPKHGIFVSLNKIIKEFAHYPNIYAVADATPRIPEKQPLCWWRFILRHTSSNDSSTPIL